MLRRYVHGMAEDDPVLWYEGAGLTSPKYLHADHQGSIIAAANSAGALGALSNINTYDEYGIPGSANQGRFGYTGQAWIAELGMYYYKARIYSPTMGRFLQTDPIGYDDQINLYAYVGNDPVNHTDPDGKCKNRSKDGGCIVTYNGDASTRRAAQKLANKLTILDKMINKISDKQQIEIKAKNGDLIGKMTGAEYKKDWNKQAWHVDPKGTDYKNGGAGASTGDGLTRIESGMLDRDSRIKNGTTTTIFHELGHRWWRNLSNFTLYQETLSSDTGKAISNHLGIGFNCNQFNTGCSAFNAPGTI